jgi:hypothetical protein
LKIIIFGSYMYTFFQFYLSETIMQFLMSILLRSKQSNFTVLKVIKRSCYTQISHTISLHGWGPPHTPYPKPRIFNVYVESGKKKDIELVWFSPDPLKLPPPPSLPETILDLTQLSAVEKLKLKVSVISEKREWHLGLLRIKINRK